MKRYAQWWRNEPWWIYIFGAIQFVTITTLWLIFLNWLFTTDIWNEFTTWLSSV